MKNLIKKARRAFTIVELVIVIAVIAILAAVLIPTFTSVISSAELSADEQAVKNMNTALFAEETASGSKPGNLIEAKEVLAEAGYRDALIPTTEGYYYFWNSEYNIVILLDLTGDTWSLVYPSTDDANSAFTQYLSSCYNLDASDATPEQTAILENIEEGNTITVGETYVAATGGDPTVYSIYDIVDLANNYGETFEGAEIKLNASITSYSANPILNFQGTFDGNSQTITIAEGGITPVYGDDGNGYLYYKLYEANKYKYSYGLFASVTNGGTVKNLTVTYQDTETSVTNPGNKYTYYGGIVGCLDDGTISGCTVTGNLVQYNRIGGIVGTALYGTIENCTVEANITSLYVSTDDAGYSYAGGIIGYAGNSTSYVKTITISNCTVGPASGSIAITADNHAGGIVARITSGISEFNVSGTTVQNVTVKINDTTSSSVGAICGGLYIENGLTGDVSVKSVNVVNHYSSNNESSDGVKFLYYTTDTQHESNSVYAGKIIRKTYSGSTLSALGVSEYTIIVGLYNIGASTNGLEYTALTMTTYTQYTSE